MEWEQLAFTETVPKMLISLSLPGTVCRDRAAPAARISSLSQAVSAPAVPGTSFPSFSAQIFASEHFRRLSQRPLLSPLAVTLP